MCMFMRVNRIFSKCSQIVKRQTTQKKTEKKREREREKKRMRSFFTNNVAVMSVSFKMFYMIYITDKMDCKGMWTRESNNNHLSKKEQMRGN